MVLVILLIACAEEIVLGVAIQRANGSVVELCPIYGILIAVVVSAVEGVNRRAASL